MSEDATELLVVPHTHWDREWYLTYQQFRMKLVDTLDVVLETLESDPEFRFFMLDGQTIMLADYLEIRPENAARLQTLARQGRLLVGPWYLQPDEFLVGGESLIRNLQKGRAMSELYGGAMSIGYVPDTFGHIAQLPQLLRGFGIDNAVFWRGVVPEITKNAFRWRAPNGSEVLVAWLNDEFGYSNAAKLPLDTEALVARVEIMATRMKPRAAMPNTLLFMNGSDHLMPQPGLPAALEAANQRLLAQHLTLRIGTLPQYIARLEETRSALQTYTGEMRSSYSAHLLPGVFSTRMWLKQRNALGEAGLIRWAEPATCWAWLLGEPYPKTELELAWQFLMQNHPHDSICGCSIDQVHAEMMPRFDQSEQIASELTERALASLATRVEIDGPPEGIPVVVFNAAGGPRTEIVTCTAQVSFSPFEVVDLHQKPMAHQVISRHGTELLNQAADKMIVMSMLGIISEGRALGYTILDAQIGPIGEGGIVPVEVLVAEQGTPNLLTVERMLAEIRELAEDERVTTFQITAREATITELIFQAEDMPSYGGRVFFLQPQSAMAGDATNGGRGEGGELINSTDEEASELQVGSTWLENACLRIEADLETGTIRLQDKVNGRVYNGLNQFMDDGDVGDLYTYCPPAVDSVIATPVEPPAIELLEHGPARAIVRIRQTYILPERSAPDRATRSDTQVSCHIVTDISLSPSSRRAEFRTTIMNTARDHRLRVLFPVPFICETVDAEGAFEVRSRRVEQVAPSPEEKPWSDWAEWPVNTQPQRRFVDMSDGEYGLGVLNRGLPEYEVLTREPGSALAVTLLRSTEWLSRADLRTRRGHAGPPLFVPEAQGLGNHTFEYALVPHAGTWASNEAFVLREADAYEAPLRATISDRHAGVLPPAWSFVRIEPAGITLCAIKRSVSGEALILRLCNTLPDPTEVEITLAAPFELVELVDLSEEVRSKETVMPLARILSSGVHTTLRSGEIQTLRFSMTPLGRQ